MINLHEKILPGTVVVQQVTCHMRALRHPVQPNASVGAVNVISANLGVDGGVDFDAGHLGARKQPPYVNVVNHVAGYFTEDGAQTSDKTSLFAMRDDVVTDNVVANVFLRPAVFQGAFDGLDIALGGVLRRIVPLVTVLSERDTDAG